MAAQRCANPTYLPEVNGMMLEYSLYKTIKAHIELFKDLISSDNSDLIDDSTASKLKTSAATTLTEIYDALICIIRANQSDTPHKQSIRFDTSLLQMLVLLRIWLVGRLETKETSRPDFSPETWQSLENERVINQTFRNIWKHYRSNPNIAPKPHLSLVWGGGPDQQTVILADHVVPRFMQISEEFFSIFQGSSEKWMHLAADLLTQSAIETLSSLSGDLANRRDDVELCFAWGYVERSRLTELFDHVVSPRLLSNSRYRNLNADMQQQIIETASQKAEVEDRIWEMFYDQGSSNNPPQSSPVTSSNANATHKKAASSEKETPQSSGELRSWSAVRQRALNDVLLTYTKTLEADSDQMDQPLETLKEHYSLKGLLAQLTDFIEQHWTMSHSQDWNGVPVLIQIEQGRLDGLDAEEFESFKQRANIMSMP